MQYSVPHAYSCRLGDNEMHFDICVSVCCPILICMRSYITLTFQRHAPVQLCQHKKLPQWKRQLSSQTHHNIALLLLAPSLNAPRRTAAATTSSTHKESEWRIQFPINTHSVCHHIRFNMATESEVRWTQRALILQQSMMAHNAWAHLLLWHDIAQTQRVQMKWNMREGESVAAL